jgi:hypothetical protein
MRTAAASLALLAAIAIGAHSLIGSVTRALAGLLAFG